MRPYASPRRDASWQRDVPATNGATDCAASLEDIALVGRGTAGAVRTRLDVSPRTHDERAHASERRFHKLLDVLPTGIWMSDAHAACTYVNKAWLDLTGRSLAQELGAGWFDRIHPDDRERRKAVHLRAARSRRPFSMQYRIRRHDGRCRWVLDNGVPRVDGAGVFLGHVGGITDITDDRSSRKALRELSGRVAEAQERECARIGRELHDNVSQRLALLSIKIDALQQALPNRVDEIAACLARLHAESCAVAREVHGLSHRLHSSTLATLGLVPAVRRHCREVAQQNLQVHFSDANVPSTLSDDAALCVFRVVQEALANVVKHSGATDATVMLSGGDGEVLLRVEDNGRGFEPRAGCAGLGLTSMRERVQLVGGDIFVRSAPHHGAVIEARLPVDRPSLQASRSRPVP